MRNQLTLIPNANPPSHERSFARPQRINSLQDFQSERTSEPLHRRTCPMKRMNGCLFLAVASLASAQRLIVVQSGHQLRMLPSRILKK